jgi:proteic killer suppression protein
MQITFASKTIQSLCEEEKHQLKQPGAKRAKRLKNRLNELRAVQNVSQLQLGRPHALTGDRAGQYSVDLDGPMRLLFEPTDQPPPTMAAGGIDWQQVTSVRLLEIGDTHG